MSADNTLLQSLLDKQGFTEFKPLKVGPETDRTLYAYIKEEHFYVCDEHLDEIQLSSLLGECTTQTLFVLVTKDEYRINTEDLDDNFFGYSKDMHWQDSSKSKAYPNFVIDTQGSILTRNVSYYKSISPFLQLCQRQYRTELPTLEKGCAYVCEFHPSGSTLRIPNAAKNDGYEIDYIEGAFLHGTFQKSYCYLFSAGDFHFFVDKDIRTVRQKLSVLYAKGELIYEGTFAALWYNSYELAILDFCWNDDLNNDCLLETIIDNEGKVSKRKIPIEGEHLWTYKLNCYEYNGMLIIENSYTYGYERWHTGIITLSSDGKIIYEYDSSGRFEKFINGLLILREYDSYDILDVYGKEIASVDKSEYRSFVVFHHEVKQLMRYNSIEAVARTGDKWVWSRDLCSGWFYGVLDTDSGEVIVPPIYSHIDLCSRYTEDEQGKSKSCCVAVVSINNYYKGETTTYKGAYVDANLVIPIGSYKDISSVNIKDTLLFIVEGRDGKRGLCKADGSELLPCEYGKIETLYGCLRADEKYIDKEGKVLFDSSGYQLVDKKSNKDGGPDLELLFGDEERYSFVYLKGGQYVFVEISQYHTPSIIIFDKNRIKTEEHHFLCWYFVFGLINSYIEDSQMEEEIERRKKEREEEEKERAEAEWQARMDEEDIRIANRQFNEMMDEYEAWGNID